MIIYKATNLINGKSYIGQTIHDLKIRIRDHNRYAIEGKSNNYFPNAINKYGPENFKWEVIDECDNQNRLNQLEIFYIGYYDTFENGYNLTIGGGGVCGYKHPEEVLENMRGKNNHFYGKHHTKESNDKNRKYQRGKKLSSLTKRRISISLKGKPGWSKGLTKEDDERLINNSKSIKKLWEDEEYRNKVIAGQRKKIITDEHRKNISIATSGENNPMFGKKQKEETRIKIGIKQKNHWQIKYQINGIMLQFK